MENLKKLYALLAILIVIYVGINFAYNGLDIFNGFNPANMGNSLNLGGGNDENSIVFSSSSFEKLDNFTEMSVSNKEVSLTNPQHKVTIKVRELGNATLSNTVNTLLSDSNTSITSNQTITQNGITAYFLYEERVDNYDAYVYFDKENKNYLISGKNISYDESDFFIGNCKEIINSIGPSGTVNYSRY